MMLTCTSSAFTSWPVLILLQIVGEVGFGFLLVHRGLVLRDVHLVIALRFGDFGVGGEFGFLPGLRGLGRTDHRIAVGFGLGDLRVAFDLGDARFAQRFEVALAVAMSRMVKLTIPRPMLAMSPAATSCTLEAKASRFW